MIVRLGIPSSFRAFGDACREIGAPALISANALCRGGRLRLPGGDPLAGLDVALDSAGFVAMVRYWHYPWNLDAYVEVAQAFPWSWWAAPDYCCEREVAGNREEVRERVKRTVFKLDWARQVAGCKNMPPPMPVLQGWEADDYELCADLMQTLPDPMPRLIGVGSMCRRQLSGPDGALAIIERLERILPAGVTLHLFGLKGSAVRALAGHPRIASVDSMAWDFAARREHVRDGFPSCTVDYRASQMRRWYAEQRLNLGLFA